ncbi:hypothetical protein IP92_00676 [Pseudoduganella flava]|uniref:Transcriptional regulator n=1 Tax=Pseudoduganella flava TaxID=871742 RepID=A0A562Q4M9_9BURK|nr:transcriptional regulator [Pseudoduganella flava]QGZ41693.1 transcriptional regulator [Pseudoduganella flava]TWI51688.1 hypothetical protein IP92_00676 [Pseudoduganella flava]
MKPSIVVLAALAAASVVALAQPPRELEQAWFKSGQDPDNYVIGVDDGGYRRGGNAKFIRHKTGKPADGNEWATLMQAVSAENYRGKRVRFSAEVRTRNVTGWAGLWMRVDQPNGESMLYNSQDKPIKGTNDWQRRSVVLDVARNAQTIMFGVIDGGAGQVWIDDLRFEVVGDDVPADRGYHSAKPPRKPSL